MDKSFMLFHFKKVNMNKFFSYNNSMTPLNVNLLYNSCGKLIDNATINIIGIHQGGDIFEVINSV